MGKRTYTDSGSTESELKGVAVRETCELEEVRAISQDKHDTCHKVNVVFVVQIEAS